MASLTQCVEWSNMKVLRFQINPDTKELRTISLIEAAAKKHGRACKCEACSTLHMERTRDKRMKAMMPGNVDMGNRQPATMGKSMKSGGPGSGRRKGGSLEPGDNPEFDEALKDYQQKRNGPNAPEKDFLDKRSGRTPSAPEKDFLDKMKQKRGPYPTTKANSALMMKKKQVSPPKQKVETIKPSNLMHEKGKILKGKEFSQHRRNKLAKQKKALPDGSFPIQNKEDLDNAKHALGRAKNIPRARAWINKRAKELKAPGIGA